MFQNLYPQPAGEAVAFHALPKQPGIFIQLNTRSGVLHILPSFELASHQSISSIQDTDQLFQLLGSEVKKAILQASCSQTDFEANLEALVKLNGEPAGYYFFIRKNAGDDTVILSGIPAHKGFTEILREKDEEIRKLNREMEEFAYIASHDLQEPLRKISTYVERMLGKLPPAEAEAVRMYTDRMVSSTKTMRTLIDDLLQFARFSREPQAWSPVNMNEAVASAITDNELLIDESKAQIYLQPMKTIEGDPVQIRQLFSNLINNALKFVAKGEVPHIYISGNPVTEEDKTHYQLAGMDYYKITCRDEGIGFKPEFSEKIFQLFQRLHAKHEYKGTGIGLAICRKIVKNHNGLIAAGSDGVRGATFTVILPIKQHVHDTD